MKIKGFIYLGNDKNGKFKECTLTIKRNEIVEFYNGFDVGIYPREYNSDLSIIEKIYKSHKSKNKIPNNCKYYIQKSTENGLMNIYLDINKTQYLNLKWGMKGFIIQSKEFIIGLSIGIVLLVLGLIFKTGD
jgi:hypothetical protein